MPPLDFLPWLSISGLISARMDQAYPTTRSWRGAWQAKSGSSANEGGRFVIQSISARRQFAVVRAKTMHESWPAALHLWTLFFVFFLLFLLPLDPLRRLAMRAFPALQARLFADDLAEFYRETLTGPSSSPPCFLLCFLI